MDRNVLAPRYMKNFHCIGPDCEDTCCRVWNIFVDKATYKKYRKCALPELKPLFKQSVIRYKDSNSDSDYAIIKLGEDGYCPLLSNEKLCRVQLELGKKFLSDVCLTYPRMTHTVNGVLEKSLTLACPEAARTILFDPNIIEFDLTSEARSNRAIIQSRLDTRAQDLVYKEERYFGELRAFAIDLLQNRSYSLEERLIILGLFSRKLQDEYIEGKKVNDIPSLIISYNGFLADNAWEGTLDKIPVKTTLQMQLLKKLTEIRSQQGIKDEIYLKCVSEFLEGISHSSKASGEELGESYNQSYSNYYKPFMDEHPYIMENYLVNQVFKNLFPFERETVFESYVMLVIQYALIKLHLIGMAGFHQGLNQDLVVRLVYSFCRNIEHSPNFLKWMLASFREKEYLTMPMMAVLIKN